MHWKIGQKKCRDLARVVEWSEEMKRERIPYPSFSVIMRRESSKGTTFRYDVHINASNIPKRDAANLVLEAIVLGLAKFSQYFLKFYVIFSSLILSNK